LGHANSAVHQCSGAQGLSGNLTTYSVLRNNNYQGWITVDFDEPRPGEGTVEENLAGYKKYLREKLKVNF